MTVSDDSLPAVLYLRTGDGRDWICGALLSDLRPVKHDGPGRPIALGEDISLVAFEVVEVKRDVDP